MNKPKNQHFKNHKLTKLGGTNLKHTKTQNNKKLAGKTVCNQKHKKQHAYNKMSKQLHP